MQNTAMGSYTISRLTLGTVQLGTDYGVSNKDGKPQLPVAFEILRAAQDCGINTFDTSRSYGTAEQIIGNFLSQKERETKPVVVTKFKLNVRPFYDLESIREEIYKSVQTSLFHLKIPRIPVLLFHKEKDQRLEELIDYLNIVVRELTSEGLLETAGISAYEPDDIDFVLNNSVMEAVQIPLNVFDLRLVNNGKLALLKQQQKIVFVRSIFLQGLFFLDPGALPEKLGLAKPFLTRLHAIAKDCGLTVQELAFAFVRDIEFVDSLIFGAVSAEQVKQNHALLTIPPLPSGVANSILHSFAEVPGRIITPGLWEL